MMQTVSSSSLTAQTLQKQTCDLCGLQLPKHLHTVQQNAETFNFCCTGCRQVFLLLSESGLLEGDYKNSDLYQTSLRLGIIGKPDDLFPDDISIAEKLKDAEELVLCIDGMW